MLVLDEPEAGAGAALPHCHMHVEEANGLVLDEAHPAQARMLHQHPFTMGEHK